ncbi:hypothetical protein F511_30801 [Dorcoceras hygrometricum]|uniref:Uncharacterized protein n=1 Tax=Dorcoceras hygrometricum TaxID=472368 RepID=A0A2Z7CJE0_9LAMI|nr:hypothetical protein F511_30801 [Dorcoceras hygrometricum]
MQSTVARDWIHCSLRLVHYLSTGCTVACDLLTADCDDVTADVIIAVRSSSATSLLCATAEFSVACC